MRAIVIALVLAALGFPAACGPGGQGAAAPAYVETTMSPAFNPTDAAWLQLMIPMTEHMIDALTLAGDHSDDPAVRSLATAVLADHRSDLARLQALRTQAGLPDGDVHAGHKMPGMVTQADLIVLRAGHGADFDRHLRPLLNAHLAQSSLLARDEQSAGKQQGTLALAHAIELHRSKDQGELHALG